MVVGTFFNEMPMWMRFLRWQQHSCVLGGGEALGDALIGLLGYAAIFQFICTPILLMTGLSQIADNSMLYRVLAFMMSTAFVTVLSIGAMLSWAIRRDVTLIEGYEMQQLTRFFSMLYLSFGSTFGGLLYGIDKIPKLFQYMSYLSTGFWSNTGVLVVVLRNQELPCNELVGIGGDGDVGAKCGISGNIILKGLGISERWYLPTYGLVFVVSAGILVGCIFAVGLEGGGKRGFGSKKDQEKRDVASRMFGEKLKFLNSFEGADYKGEGEGKFDSANILKGNSTKIKGDDFMFGEEEYVRERTHKRERSEITHK